jgi:serine/threonine-protein kinase
VGGDLVDGKYRILRAIGEGGWGIVFEGENTRTMRHVALKTLRPQAKLTKDIIARFEREAQAAGRIAPSTSSRFSISERSLTARTTWSWSS